jgi:hypothetical protein
VGGLPKRGVTFDTRKDPLPRRRNDDGGGDDYGSDGYDSLDNNGNGQGYRRNCGNGRRNHRGDGGGGGDGGGDDPDAAIQKEIDNFKKGTKRDKNEYPKYKDKRYWDSFKLKVTDVARSHGLLDVITPNYVPSTEKEQELLTLKNNFMFAVWATKLLTPLGKRSVRKHRATGDAQAVWREIQHDALNTTRASMHCDTIHTFLTANKYSNQSWKSSARNYLLYWETQADLFNQMQFDPMGQLNNYQLLRLLKNAVSLSPILHSVHLTDNFDQQRGKFRLNMCNTRLYSTRPQTTWTA